MNNIFDIKRFGNYLLYDLRNAWNRFGISLFICGLMPIIIFVFSELLVRVIGGEWVSAKSFTVAISFFVTYMVVILSFPAKAYGNLTDKRAGSSWIMFPASTLEKWISMLVVTCIVLPMCLWTLFIGSDQLLSAIFPLHYGHTLISNIGYFANMLAENTDNVVSMNFPAAFYLNWCENILVFTLGAIVFRTAKPAKTILCLIALGMVLSFVSVGVFANVHMDSDSWMNFDASGIEAFVNRMNMFVNAVYIVVFAILLGATYYRMRTIKH